MILAVVDDLLFSSKIRAAAHTAGASVTFARTSSAALAALPKQHPTTIILDLDRSALEPLEIIRAIRSDPALSHVNVVAFASHVHGDLILAARAAGANQVLARSGFVAALPGLLSESRG